MMACPLVAHVPGLSLCVGEGLSPYTHSPEPTSCLGFPCVPKKPSNAPAALFRIQEKLTEWWWWWWVVIESKSGLGWKGPLKII